MAISVGQSLGEARPEAKPAAAGRLPALLTSGIIGGVTATLC